MPSGVSLFRQFVNFFGDGAVGLVNAAAVAAVCFLQCAIIQQNLANAHAVNDVTSIVFDFRGYDTMGEAFILITAVAGSAVILYKAKKEKEEQKDE